MTQETSLITLIPYNDRDQTDLKSNVTGDRGEAMACGLYGEPLLLGEMNPSVMSRARSLMTT